MLRTSDLDYHLPEDLIATHPATPREAARLMVVSRASGDIVEHAHIRDLPRFLRASDLLVLNHTRVLPARFEGWRIDTNGGVEGLYLQPGGAFTREPNSRTWVALLSGKRMKEGIQVGLLSRAGHDSGYRLRLIQRFEGEGGAWLVQLEHASGAPVAASDVDVLDQVGLTPLPPYIRAARKRHELTTDDSTDRERYQTVYAQNAAAVATHQHTTPLAPPREVGVPTTGSVAAPTAGLHLTPELLATLASMGVRRAEVVLHVGLGTFKSVETEFVEQHPMHHERCAIARDVIDTIRATRATTNARVICVGTTSARTVESYARAMSTTNTPAPPPSIPPAWLDTNLLITPGYRWHWTQGLLTNFHLPRSTLLAMIASLLEPENSRTTPSPSEGLARVKGIYEAAVTHRYRFYSFGDAMLIL